MSNTEIMVSLKTLGIKRSSLKKKLGTNEIGVNFAGLAEVLLAKQRDLYTIKELEFLVTNVVYTTYDGALLKSPKKYMEEEKIPAIRIYYTAKRNLDTKNEILEIIAKGKLKDEKPAPTKKQLKDEARAKKAEENAKKAKEAPKAKETKKEAPKAKKTAPKAKKKK